VPTAVEGLPHRTADWFLSSPVQTHGPSYPDCCRHNFTAALS